MKTSTKIQRSKQEETAGVSISVLLEIGVTHNVVEPLVHVSNCTCFYFKSW